MSNTITPTVFYRTLNVEGLEIFYREAGPRDAPTVLLLHGFPSSSHMFRNLIPMLADKYHVVAPDFPGYVESSAPSVNDFDYSYERLATVTEKFTERMPSKRIRSLRNSFRKHRVKKLKSLLSITPQEASTRSTRHDAHAVVYVLDGEVEMQVRGGTLRRFGPGQVFTNHLKTLIP